MIRFYWDNEEQPSIETPTLEFFAIGHGKFAPIQSAVVTLNPLNAMNCYWPMPFRNMRRLR